MPNLPQTTALTPPTNQPPPGATKPTKRIHALAKYFISDVDRNMIGDRDIYTIGNQIWIFLIELNIGNNKIGPVSCSYLSQAGMDSL